MLTQSLDPIVAIATAAGRGAVGIVRVSGVGLAPLVQTWLGRVPRAREATYLPFPDAQGQPIDLARVHFTGALPHADYLRVLQVSRAHVYLTYPFILSWSLIEAMSVGCVLITSGTAPVQEVITDGVQGLHFAFKDHDTLARLAINALADPAGHAHLGQAARQLAQERFDFETVSLPAYRALLDCC